ncbi:MAG: hypothetical protein PUG48_00140 [Clostridia bacterium]|nr:hypothetical protein [Clostridia bacterium]
MLKNIFKYFVCAAVALAVTGGVIFLPYTYYSANDKKIENDYKTEEFKINTNQNNITPKKAVEILHSENSIMIQVGEKTDEKILFEKIDSAFATLKTYLTSSNMAQFFMQSYEKCSTKNFFTYHNYVVSGTSDEIPVSLSVIAVEFETELFNISMTLDSETNTIYQLNMSCFYDANDCEVVGEPYDSKDKIDEFDDDEHNAVYKDIMNYWNETDAKFIVEIDDNRFVFY